jgi:hypothetical protein
MVSSVNVPRALLTLFESSKVALTLATVVPGESRLVLVNQAFLTLSGYSLDQVIGRDCRFLQGEREQPPDALASIRRAISKSDEIVVHLRNIDAGGREFDNLLFMHPLFSDSGTLRFYLGSQYDVTRPVFGMTLEDHAAALETFIEKANADLAHDQLSLMSTLGRVSAATAKIARNAMFLDRRLGMHRS